MNTFSKRPTLLIAAGLFLGVVSANAQTATPTSTSGIDIPQAVVEIRALLADAQYKLAQQQLPPLMQVRLQVQSVRDTQGRRSVLRSDQSITASTQQSALLFFVPLVSASDPIPPPPNPLAQPVEDAILKIATGVQQQSIGKTSGKWLAQDINIDFTVSTNGPEGLAFSVLQPGASLAASLPVHRVTLTLAVQQ